MPNTVKNMKTNPTRSTTGNVMHSVIVVEWLIYLSLGSKIYVPLIILKFLENTH
jgi:hypothetical protein